MWYCSATAIDQCAGWLPAVPVHPPACIEGLVLSIDLIRKSRLCGILVVNRKEVAHSEISPKINGFIDFSRLPMGIVVLVTILHVKKQPAPKRSTPRTQPADPTQQGRFLGWSRGDTQDKIIALLWSWPTDVSAYQQHLTYPPRPKTHAGSRCQYQLDIMPLIGYRSS